MERARSVDLFTLFNSALVKCARNDFVGLYKDGENFTLYYSNNAAEFNELVNPGVIQARIIFGKLHIGEVDKETQEEMKFQARRYNENINNN
jgi:hypothetical protein